MVKKRGVERRVRKGLETRGRIGWWQRGMRAMQFKATSSGRDGIRLLGGAFGASASPSEEVGFHMASVVLQCYLLIHLFSFSAFSMSSHTIKLILFYFQILFIFFIII